VGKRALITGFTGQDGSYLAELLLEKEYEVFGMVRRLSAENYERVEHLLDQVKLVEGDLLDEYSIMDVLTSTSPGEVYNLAAQSFVPTSFSQPMLTAQYNALGPLRFLEAIRRLAPDTRFYQASTSEMFGHVREVPQTEMTPLSSALTLRCRKSIRALYYRELSRVLRNPCQQWHPVQSRIASPRHEVRHQKDHRWCGTHQAGARARA